MFLNSNSNVPSDAPNFLLRFLRWLEHLPIKTIWGVKLAGFVLGVLFFIFVSMLLGLILLAATYAFHFHFFVCPHCYRLLPILLNPHISPYCPKCGKPLESETSQDNTAQ